MALITECCNRPIADDERFCPRCGWEARVATYARKQGEMQPHQQRVVDEKAELSDKTDKLETFVGGSIYASLPPEEQARLTRQHLIMQLYEQVLSERISAF